VNAAKFLLRSLGLGREAKSLTTQEAWEKLLQRGAVEPVREYVAMHADVWRVAQEKFVLLEKELKESLKPFKSVADRLEKVPGVGTITAATYIAVLATPDRFVESGRVISYIGLIPSGYDTDDSVRRGHIANHAFRVRSCGRCCASALIMQRRALTPSTPTGCGF
jgi:transposase